MTLKEQGFYNRKAWHDARRMVLQRDHYTCQFCLTAKKDGELRGLPKRATEVHHLKPLEDFPELGLELSNLVSLCRDCHERTKHRKEKEGPKGVRVIKV